jgi:hypothetical protein
MTVEASVLLIVFMTECCKKETDLTWFIKTAGNGPLFISGMPHII